MSIYIFCRPVHSGKTSELQHWCNKQKNIGGILMPDISGSRKIMDIKTQNIFDIECKDVANNLEPLTTVGRFRFYTTAFEKANNMLQAAIAQRHDWLIIDEAGKLELQRKGFYESIVKAVAIYNADENKGNLLIAVRESLCAEVISFFHIKNAKVINTLQHLV